LRASNTSATECKVNKNCPVKEAENGAYHVSLPLLMLLYCVTPRNIPAWSNIIRAWSNRRSSPAEVKQRSRDERATSGEENPLLPLPGLSQAASHSTGQAPPEPHHQQFLLFLQTSVSPDKGSHLWLSSEEEFML